MKSAFRVIFCLAFVCLPALGWAGLRTWTAVDGRKVEAEYVKVEAGQVYLKPANGKIVPVPFARLSEADQAFVKKLYSVAPLSIAAQVDAQINKKLAAANVKPNPRTTDEQFVRRAYLEIAGTIPSYDQTLDFLESKDRDKRRKLIDKLLDSEEYVSHSFDWYADFLRVVSRTDAYYIFENYIDWIKKSVRENKPYDRFVYEMLTAKGSLWDEPAAGYFLRDRGMPLGNLSTTATAFLGTEITCAECHDHPFEDWTQRDFYSLAAFLAQREDRNSDREMSRMIAQEQRRIEAEQRQSDPSLKGDGFNQQFRQMVAASQAQVWDNATKVLKLPSNYKYDDGKPDQVVTPHTLFGENPDLSKYESPRQAFASWVTAKENPLFTKTIVNRLWKRVFGLALHEPMGNLQDIKKSANPELFAYLEGTFKDLDFNIKEFLRALYYSESWQRQATLEGPTLAEISSNKYLFPGPVLKRMTAEQLWNSFLTLTVPDPSQYQRDVAEPLAKMMTFDIQKVSGAESKTKATELQELTSRTINSGAPSLAVWSTGGDSMDSSSASMVKYAGSYLARASEISQPAPNGHFLRAWGQGDRNLAESSSDNGSVPQILNMINGPFTQMLIKPDSLIFKTTGSQRGTGDKMEKIYLSILNRHPEGKERTVCSKAIRSDDEGYGDLIWALVNTREFLFIR